MDVGRFIGSSDEGKSVGVDEWQQKPGLKSAICLDEVEIAVMKASVIAIMAIVVHLSIRILAEDMEKKRFHHCLLNPLWLEIVTRILDKNLVVLLVILFGVIRMLPSHRGIASAQQLTLSPFGQSPPHLPLPPRNETQR